ncbi:MAG: pitrilysin family protein [Candidatus Acidiferrales bacterium]
MTRNLRILLKVSAVLSLVVVWQAAAQAPADTGRVTEFDVNGLKVIVKRRPASDTVAVGLFIRGGSSNITEANAGIEALLLTAAAEGSARFPRSEMNAALTGMGSTISSGSNNDYSSFALACTRTAFDRSWEIFADAALHPLLLSADIERDRAALIAAARARLETPEPLLSDIRRRAVFAGHPYQNDPDGTPESLAKITVDDLRAYHKQIMQRSRLLLVIVGDLDPAAIRPRIEATFGALPAGETRSAATPLFAFDKPSVQVTERALPSTYFEGVFAGPQFKSPDTDALAIAMAILQDRVFYAVRVKNALAYDPEASHSELSASYGYVSASSTDVCRAAELMLEEIRRMKDVPVAADDLSSVVAQFSTDYYVQIQTSASQAGRLALYEINGGGWRNGESRLDRLRAVTPGDVQRVARQYMHDLQFVILGDAKSVKKGVFTAQP